MAASSRTEVALPGGTANRGFVVRVGDTVRRPMRATSPATHALLGHLEAVGFDGSPRYLGVDEQGREVLSYVHGQTPIHPYPPWALTDEALASLARLLGRFHEAVAGFVGTDLTWQREVPEPFRTVQVSHNDPNLDNVVFRGSEAVALIDFDLAGAGSRVWDLAMAARLWCPLREDGDIRDARGGRSLRRLAVLLDTYRATAAERDAFVDAVLLSHHWAYDHVAQEVANGHAGFTEHWLTDRARERADRTWAWLGRHRDDLPRVARG